LKKISDLVLFETESGSTAWTRFCLRQCDRIVLVANGDTAPQDCEAMADRFVDLPHTTSLSLVLLWKQEIVAERTTRWLKSVKPGGHHHVRSSRDLERASRLIVGPGKVSVRCGGPGLGDTN
jgi:NTE family protein